MKATWKIETRKELESQHNIYRIRWYEWIIHPIRSYRNSRAEGELTKMLADAIKDEIDREILEHLKSDMETMGKNGLFER